MAERPSLGSRGKSRSTTSLAGEMMTGTSSKLSKDWDLSRDLAGREQHLARHRTRRKSSKDGVHYMGASPEGPFVRGPRFEPVDASADIWSWHENRAKSVFAQLDIKQCGEISLDALQDSFSVMKVPIDEDMFAKYCNELLPAGAVAVSFQQFLDFHKAVWSNQPAPVRRRAGCAQAVADPGAGVTVRDLRDLEGQLRRAYRNHSNEYYEPLRIQQLPAVFKDLGLDTGSLPEVESQARKLFNVSDSDTDGKLSFHEFVEFQNRYVASLETVRASSFADNFKASAAKNAAKR